MKTLKQYNKSSNELQQLDEDTRQELIEISLGKNIYNSSYRSIKTVNKKD